MTAARLIPPDSAPGAPAAAVIPSSRHPVISKSRHPVILGAARGSEAFPAPHCQRPLSACGGEASD